MNWLILFITILNAEARAEITLQVTETSIAKIYATESSEAHTVTLNPDQKNMIEMKGPVEITSESRIPIILIPVKGQNAVITLDPAKKKEVIDKISDAEVNQKLMQLLPRIQKVQILMQKAKLDSALTELKRIQSEFPKLKFLDFTQASILLLQGNKNQALELAEAALKYFPEYEEGRDFVNKLKGQHP